MKFFYVYQLASEFHPGRHYTGHTTNLKVRLAAHNSGKVVHTRPQAPPTPKAARPSHLKRLPKLAQD